MALILYNVHIYDFVDLRLLFCILLPVSQRLIEKRK